MNLPQLISWSLFFLLLLSAASCRRERREKAIGEGYIGSTSAALRDRLGATSGNVGTVKAGERIEVLQRRRRWARIRTAAGVEGWLEERHVVAADIYERGRQAMSVAAGRPSQGQARARDLVNLHLDPERRSPTIYQLQGGELCDVVDHRAVDRPLPPGAARPPPAPPPVAKKRGGRKKAVPGLPPKEDWFLVRAPGKAGWALARFFDMAIPDEVAQYAEGRAVTAWHVLNDVTDGAEKKAQYVWGTSETVGSPCDFDGIRVFTWNVARDRYETAYRQRGFCGKYPLLVTRERLPDGSEAPAFTVTSVDDEQNPSTRTFLLVGNFVKKK